MSIVSSVRLVVLKASADLLSRPGLGISEVSWALPMLVEHIHENYVKTRRVAVLQQHFLALLPPETSDLLDVGTGDGTLAAAVSTARPSLRVIGVDTVVRPGAAIPVIAFDGRRLPFANEAFDAVSFVDVLHHADDLQSLLIEGARVARHSILIKDHVVAGWLARPTLRLMDEVGNRRFGVSLPYNYQTRADWDAHFARIDWQPVEWRTALGLYPPWANWLFGRQLHCFLRLRQSREQ